MMHEYSRASAAKAYQQGHIMHAEPVQVIILLYDGAIQRVAQSEADMRKGNHLGAGIGIYQALAIIGQLRRSLNHEAGRDLATNLDALYRFVHDELVQANLQRHVDRLAGVRGILSQLRDAWVELDKQAKAGAQAAPNVRAPGPVMTGRTEVHQARAVLVKA